MAIKKSNKRLVLNQIFQGYINGLEALKKEQHRTTGIVIVDRMPDIKSNEPILASYTLNNGTRVTKLLTYTEILTKAGEILILLPDNHRGPTYDQYSEQP